MYIVSEPILNDIKTSNGKLKVYVSITIKDMKSNYYLNKYYGDSTDTLKVNPNPRLVIKMDFTDAKWDGTKQFSVNKNYITRFNRELKRYYKYIMTGKNYIYDDTGEILIDISKDKRSVLYINYGYQSILIEPDIFEENNINKPGIRFTINDPANTMVLSIDEFEDIVYTVDKLDLISLGNQLVIINESINKIRGIDEMKSLEERKVEKTKVKEFNIFDRPSVDEEVKESVSGIIQRQKPTSLFEL